MKTLAAITLFACVSAQAGYVTGNKLDSMLKGDNIETAIGSGYVLGVFDSYYKVGHCAPDTVSITQVIDMAKIMLKTSPATRNEPADILLLEMLGKYWPCPKQTKSL